MRLAVVGFGMLAAAILSAPVEALVWLVGTVLVIGLVVVGVLLAVVALGDDQ